MSKIEGCCNNFDDTNIEALFAESEESLKKCNKCPHFSYDGGIAQCEKCSTVG